jgi:hypothetical protein
MSWYSTGFNSAVQQDAAKYTDSSFQPDRVWIPVGQSRELVFVDDLPAVFREHNAKINGSWRNPFTCLAPVMENGEEPPCCEKLGEKNAYTVAASTVIDCTKWTDKKGKVRQYEIKVLPAKYSTSQKLERKRAELEKDGKTLVGRLYRVTRETSKSPAVGDDYEYVRDVDMSKLLEFATFRGKKFTELLDAASAEAEKMAALARTFSLSKTADGRLERKLVPFNYMSIFEPKTPREVREMLKGYVAEDDDSRGGGSNSSRSDDTPF